MSSFGIRRIKKPVFRPTSEDFFLSENLKKQSIVVPPPLPKLEPEIGFFEFNSLNLKKPKTTPIIQKQPIIHPHPREQFLRGKIEEYQNLKKINEEEPECPKVETRDNEKNETEPITITEISGNEISEECVRNENVERMIETNPIIITEISQNEISEECIKPEIESETTRHINNCDCIDCICPFVTECCPIQICAKHEPVICVKPEPVICVKPEPVPEPVPLPEPEPIITTNVEKDTDLNPGTIVMLSDGIVPAEGKASVLTSGLLPALPNQRVNVLAISDNIALLRIIGPFQLNNSTPIFSLNDNNASLIVISKFQNGECIWAKGIGITPQSAITYGSITQIDGNDFAVFISSNEDWSNFFEIITLNESNVQTTGQTSVGQAAAEAYRTSVAARAILSNNIPQTNQNTFSFINPPNYIPSFPVPTSRTVINETPTNSTIGTRQINLLVQGAQLESLARDAPSIQINPPRLVKIGTIGIKINKNGNVLTNNIWTPMYGPISSSLSNFGILLAASGLLSSLKSLTEMRSERIRRRVNSKQNINRLNESFENNIASVEINRNGVMLPERREPNLSGLPTPGGVLPPSAYLPRPNTINAFDIPKGGAIKLAKQKCGNNNSECINNKIAPSPVVTKRNKINNNTALEINLSNQANEQLNNINIASSRTVVAVHFLTPDSWKWNGISPLRVGLSTGMTPSVGGIVSTGNGYGISINVQTQNRDESFPILIVNENVNRYMEEYPNALFPTFWEQRIDYQRSLNFNLPTTLLTNWVANGLVFSNNNFISLLSWIPRRNIGQISRLPTLPSLQMRGVLLSMRINQACSENGVCTLNQPGSIELNWIKPLVWTLPRGVSARTASSPLIEKQLDDGSIIVTLPSSAPGVSLLRFNSSTGERLWGLSIQGLSDSIPLISQTGYLVGRAGIQNVSVFRLDDQNNLIQPPLVVLSNNGIETPRLNTGIPGSSNITRLVNMKIETILPRFLGVVNQNQTVSWIGNKTDGFTNLTIGSFISLNSLNEFEITRERINTSFGVSIGASTMLFQPV